MGTCHWASCKDNESGMVSWILKYTLDYNKNDNIAKLSAHMALFLANTLATCWIFQYWGLGVADLFEYV